MKNTSSALEIQVLKNNKKHVLALISHDGDVNMLEKLPFVTSLKKIHRRLQQCSPRKEDIFSITHSTFHGGTDKQC